MTYTPTKQSIRQHYLELSETVSGSQEIAQGNVESFDRWHQEELRQAKEEAWDEGFDAGEQDVLEHKTFNEPCIPNPYRSQP